MCSMGRMSCFECECECVLVMPGPKRKNGVIRSTDTSGDVTPSSTIGALTSRHVCVR